MAEQPATWPDGCRAPDGCERRRECGYMGCRHADRDIGPDIDARIAVIDLDAYRIKHGGDDAGFLHCPRCEGGDWAVVCRGVPGKPFIAALVCVECDPPQEMGVVNGYVSA